MEIRTHEQCTKIREYVLRQYFSNEPIDKGDYINELEYCCDKTCKKYLDMKQEALNKNNIPLQDDNKYVLIQFNELDCMNAILIPAVHHIRMEWIINTIYHCYDNKTVKHVNTVLIRNGIPVDEIDPSVFPEYNKLLSYDHFKPKECDLVIVGSLSMKNGKHLCCPVKFVKHCHNKESQ